ncbi:MAG: LysM peptidoglycan-binding domain-containing protein [Candidatus Cloacimonetes bacterium]|nr:LysM peptidoglycan-binding domain-containing protein [Candidatus Cloacimonadota bacterium]MDD4156711.1 LysM peptidoglycan-binding domain-containing protein [Candidatus Cloacimonadota bacterium]
MKKKIQIIALIVIFVLPIFLNASVNYLNEDDYKKLSKTERQQYWNQLETEMTNLQQRKADAIAANERLTVEIEALRTNINDVDTNISDLFDRLNITDANLAELRSKIQYFKDQLNNWENMSDDDLWKNAKAFKELNEDFNNTKAVQIASLPEFKRDFNDLDRRFKAINDALKAANTYYEDNYSVVKGDYLSKISGYDFIYGDHSKWGIIFRANRDQIKDPNIIYEGQNLRIPRGLPTTWKVYRGESLWKISSYPEVYGSGTKWPVIYRANRDQIKDPDLIYPNQIFDIPRDNN